MDRSLIRPSMAVSAATALADLPVEGSAGTHDAQVLTNPVIFPTAGRVCALVEKQAAQHPDRPAIVTAGTVVNYRSLTERIDRMAAVLREQGCRAGDVVACIGHRDPLSSVVFLALERLGAVYLPLDPGWPPARVAEILRLSGSTFLVDYTSAEPAVQVRERTANPLPVNETEEPRYVIYTSGTTGRPKGAIVAQPGMLNHLWAKVADLDLTANDCLAFTAPLVFDISIWQMLAALLVGGRLLVVTDDELRFPRRLHNMLARHRVSVLELVPTALGLLLDETARRGGEDRLPTLRWLISTGEELKPSLAQRALTALPHVALLNAYGPTECSDDVTHHVVTPADLDRPRLPVGRPIGNAMIRCLVRRPGGAWAPAESGEVGEIFVAGVPVGLGYLADEKATRAAFFRDPFGPAPFTRRLYRTGDLGRTEHGLVHYLGRVDRQVKVGGLRIELDEIEAVLSRHPAVGHCAVTVAERGARKVLMAHYVPRTPVTAEELASFLRDVLPAGAVPGHWDEADALPLTANGKTDHQALVKRLSAS